ncbi:hypothetical protein HS125_05200 [bacterium]|nr:hypothetical protein [bacterium]
MRKRILLGCLMTLLGAGMIAASSTRAFPVYDEDLPEDEFAFYQEVSEIRVTWDGTFAGVLRSSSTGRLVTTYDRDAPPERPACPT